MIQASVATLLPQAIDDLSQLCRIPSISFPGYDLENLDRSAEAVAKLCSEYGFPLVHVVRNPERHIGQGGSPAVIAAWGNNPDLPTILLYAHHDVQPEMLLSKWLSPPFEPALRAGRLFARGAADDKAGILVHLAAIKALRSVPGALCPNIRLILEGEEEVGSPGLAELLFTHRDFLQCDVAIVADLGNFATGEPALTASLRGMVAFEVEVRAIENTVHSGLWSGPIPDPAQGLCKIIASLTDAQGNIAIPGVLNSVIPPDQATLDSYRSLGITAASFRAEAGVRPGVQLLVEASEIPATLWRRPSLTVTTFEAGKRGAAGNVLLDSAYARISIRLVPGMDWKTVVKQVTNHIQTICLWGLELSITPDEGANAWTTSTTHSAFQIMLDALQAGYGKPARILGCGASIPGAPIFSEVFGDIPVLLTGLEDPQANAHGENESLDLEDFRKAICAEAEFLWRMAENKC
jgi:acetylornithine deacetylase/succinyl-diaminopimelate desuccinylase-like protein